MKSKTVKMMCAAGIFTAMIFVFTAYVHIPSHTGYTHIGDGFIYLAAAMLPTPYAVFAGACGAVLADCLTGFAVWAPASALIKAAAVLFFTYKRDRIICVRNVVALLPAWAICIGGYYLYESLITANFVAPLAGIVGYVTQCALSSALFLAVGAALDKISFKKKAALFNTEQKSVQSR